MCGIAGAFGPSHNERPLDSILRMAQTLRHRGPDGGGEWVDEAASIAVGHRRLAIVDLSPAGHQPMVSACGRYVIVFNGEIYNHMRLRALLEASCDATKWRGHSDTETLLSCFAAWGIEKTLQCATGMFAIALWDRETRTLTLARDRIGEKPLYYGWQSGCLLFGSELKALRAHPAFAASIDRRALVLFLRHGYVPAPYSIYEGIQKLPAGTLLQVGEGQRDAVPAAWWSLSEVAHDGTNHPFAGSDAEAVDALESALGGAVRQQMVADVPLGALLSGGLDSSLITALMQANSPRPVRTFTIGFEEREYDEATHARAIAGHLGTDHVDLRLSGGDALDLVPSLPVMYDEPFADSSQLPTHLVMKLARKYVTVALSGDAGDEMFGGYNRYVHVPKLWRALGWMPPQFRQALGAALTALPSDTIERLAGPAARAVGVVQVGDKMHKLGARLRDIHSLDDFYLSLVRQWKQAEQMVVGGSLPPNLLDQREQWPKLQDPVARMMALDALTYLPDDILVKVDRAAMAVSLETRAPFLDRDVMSLAWSLPLHMKIRDGQGKWLVRRLLDRHVPRSLMERPKMGFGVPLDAWLRGPLRDWAETLLDEGRLRREGYLEPGIIRAAWRSHLTGSSSRGHGLWSVLMFQAWREASV